MPDTCSVMGCSSRRNRTKKFRFFHYPKIRVHEGEQTRLLSEKRRRLWIARVNRDFEPSPHSLVCSEHFVTGKIADLYQQNHVDWAPSLKLDLEISKRSKARYALYQRKRERDVMGHTKVMEKPDPISTDCVKAEIVDTSTETPPEEYTVICPSEKSHHGSRSIPDASQCVKVEIMDTSTETITISENLFVISPSEKLMHESKDMADASDSVEMGTTDTSAETVHLPEKYTVICPSEKLNHESRDIVDDLDCVEVENVDTQTVTPPEKYTVISQFGKLNFENEDMTDDPDCVEMENMDTIAGTVNPPEHLLVVCQSEKNDHRGLGEVNASETIAVSHTNNEPSPEIQLDSKQVQVIAALEPHSKIALDDPRPVMIIKSSDLAENGTKATTQKQRKIRNQQFLKDQQVTSNLDQACIEPTIQDTVNQQDNIFIEKNNKKEEQKSMRDSVKVPCHSLSLSEIVKRDHDYLHPPDPAYSSKTMTILIHSRPIVYQHQGGRYWSCILCGIVLYGVGALVAHVDQRHGRYKLKVPCPECGVQITSGSMREHYRIHHIIKDSVERYNPMKDSLLCHICGKSFVSTQGMNYHLRWFHSDEVVFCEQCPASFRSIKTLKWHTRYKHEGKVDSHFKCGLCDRVFVSKRNQKRHIRLIHEAGPQKPFECNQCGKRFTQECTLKLHTDTIHRGIYKHICEICDARFSMKGFLNKHKLKHEQPGYKFRGRGKQSKELASKYLGIHIERKDEEEGWRCGVCSEVCSTKVGIKRHIKSVHNPDKDKQSGCK